MVRRRKACACAVFNGFLYVVGGNDNSSSIASVERFDGTAWEEVSFASSCKQACTARHARVLVSCASSCLFALSVSVTHCVLIESPPSCTAQVAEMSTPRTALAAVVF